MKLYMGPLQYFLERYLTNNINVEDEDLIITKPIKYAKIEQIVAHSGMVLDILTRIKAV